MTDPLSKERIHQVRETLRIQSIRIDVEGAMDRARRELETFDALLAERTRDAEVVEKAAAYIEHMRQTMTLEKYVEYLESHPINAAIAALARAVELRERG